VLAISVATAYHLLTTHNGQMLIVSRDPGCLSWFAIIPNSCRLILGRALIFEHTYHVVRMTHEMCHE